ncbi:hypothetical protein ICA16_06145 [Pseudomonas anatoliensis]|uniref:hypothetical protein n=1 Tax=Pseudomonas anatoliensis TaxID=2710589 RepID=UPI001B31B507|nr:hypothetical protein [Pseudomonas anatoliensis]MBP5955237.1 hypothetical protein [Pseudomonas anatoliensis]
MSLRDKDSQSAALTLFSASCDVQASISNRVNFNTQNIQFGQHSDGKVEFRARSYEGYKESAKGITFKFPSDIKTGSYETTDPVFPFEILSYFETGAYSDFLTIYSYAATSGTVEVEVISNDPREMRYLISFDFKGKDHRTEELHITGKAELTGFIRAT